MNTLKKGDERSLLRSEEIKSLEKQKDSLWIWICGQLSRIKDPSKMKSRIRIFSKEFPVLNDGIKNFDVEKYLVFKNQAKQNTQEEYINWLIEN